MNRYKASYRSVIGVIFRKIEADGTRVTTLVRAIRHADLTHSGGSDSRRICTGTISICPIWPFYGALIAYFLWQIDAVRGVSAVADAVPVAAVTR